MSKLVAGHPQDNEPLVSVALMEVVHLGVIPGCRASERRHVLYQHHFVLQGREAEGLSCQEFGREVVEVSSHGLFPRSPLATLVSSAQVEL